MQPIPLTPRFLLAVQTAHALHERQARKGTHIPYLGHLMSTASIVLQFGGDEEQAIAALLHDAAEDQGGRATLERIRLAFGERVARIVEGCTDTFEDPKPEWAERKRVYIEDLQHEPRDVLLVSAADKLDNARAINGDLRRHGHALWSRFTGGDRSVDYYRRLVNAYRPRDLGPIVDELDAAVTEMETLAAKAAARAR